jgi:hypothetical protein
MSPRLHLRTGDKVLARCRPEADWVEGRVVLASENGISLILCLEHMLGHSGTLLQPELGLVVVLASWTEEGWLDLATGEHLEIAHGN